MATTDRKMTGNPVVQRIIGLIEEQGKKNRDLTDFLGLSPSTITKWKYDGSNVYLKYIEPICEFLDTTPNYLFIGQKEESDFGSLTPVEIEVIRRFRKLDNGRKKCIRETLRYFTDVNLEK